MKKIKTKPVSEEELKFNDEFGSRVRDLKRQKGFTSEKLAELAGVSYQWISTIENKKTRRGVSVYVAHRLANALGTTIDYLSGSRAVVDEDTAFEMLKRARERKRLNHG